MHNLGKNAELKNCLQATVTYSKAIITFPFHLVTKFSFCLKHKYMFYMYRTSTITITVMILTFLWST